MLAKVPIPARRVAVASVAARQIILLLTALGGLPAGIWATLSPEGFYRSFPGFGLIWIAVDGPYNEHLIRDVGAFYLALAAASLAAFALRSAAAARVVGVAWTVFGVPHLAYHATHLGGFGPIDIVGNLLGLGGSLLLGLLLLLPTPDATGPASPGLAVRGRTVR